MSTPESQPTPDAVPLFTPVFARLTLAHFTVATGVALALHLAGMLHDFGAREAEIGRIIALTPLTALLLTPLAGRLIDVRGRTPVLRAGVLLMCVANAGYALLTSLGPMVYATRVLDGVGATLLYASLFTYASDVVPEGRRTQGIALFGAAGLASLILCGPLGDALLAAGGYRWLFTAALASFGVGAVLAFSLPELRVRDPNGSSAADGLQATALQRDLLPIWVAAFPFFLTMSGVMTFMKTFALHIGDGGIGPFFTTYACVALVLRLPFGALPDRVGPRRMVLPALLAYAAGALALANARDLSGLIVAGMLCGAGHGYSFPVLLSLTVSRARPAARGSATALFTTIDWAGHVAAPPLVGFAIEQCGYATAFAGLGAAVAFGLAAFYMLDARPLRAAAS